MIWGGPGQRIHVEFFFPRPTDCWVFFSWPTCCWISRASSRWIFFFPLLPEHPPKSLMVLPLPFRLLQEELTLKWVVLQWYAPSESLFREGYSIWDPGRGRNGKNCRPPPYIFSFFGWAPYVYCLNYRPKCPEFADFCYFGIIPMS